MASRRQASRRDVFVFMASIDAISRLGRQGMDQGMEIGGDTMTKRYWEWDPVFSLDPAKSALLVIDMQNGFIEEGAILEVPMARRQVPTVKKLVRYCRDNGIPVVFTRFRITGEEGTHRFYWRLAKQRGLDIASPDFEFL